MKKRPRTFQSLILLFVLLLLPAASTWAGDAPAGAKYVCFQCRVGADGAGACPLCKAAFKKAGAYLCPTCDHTSDKPGKCPCGRDFVKVELAGVKCAACGYYISKEAKGCPICSAKGAASGPDPVKIAPANHRVLFENAEVRTYEVWLKPGEKMAMHSHPRTAVYVVSGGRLDLSGPDGKVESKDLRAGEALYHGPLSHAVENTGSSEVRLIVTEIKR